MELFFLCTIIMAGISFLSIALSQPPVNYSFKIKGKTNTTSKESEKEHSQQVSFANIQSLPEMAAYGVAG